MAAQNKLFQRVIWLADTIYSAGPITLDELDRRWAQSAYNYDHESHYDKRNFHRHRDLIQELFGIGIVCNRSTNTYSIGEISKSSSAGVRGWIVNTFALNNLTNLDAGMQERVIFEQIPEGMRFLTTIINAMKQSRQLVVSYQGFKRDKPHSFLLEPYCLKVFKQRWYLVGKPEDHPEEKEPRVYALDRVKDITETNKTFHLPHRFKPATFFKNQFGIDRSITKAEKIRVKVDAYDANFLRSLPLHESQTELERNDDYSVFAYTLATTYDFIMELRKFGPKLEVLAPKSLRDSFKDDIQKMQSLYED